MSFSDDEEVDEELAHHVHEISRHRNRWEAPATPPGYWDINFPDTQEAAAINLRARDMHVQKMRRVEAEARYRTSIIPGVLRLTIHFSGEADGTRSDDSAFIYDVGISDLRKCICAYSTVQRLMILLQ